MACKNKPGLARKGMDEMNKVAHAAGEIVSASAKRALGSGTKLGVRGAREAVGVQRKMFKGALDVFDMVQKQAGKTMDKALEGSEYLPTEAQQVAKEWARVLKIARAELKTAIEKSFDLVDQYLKRVEESAKKAAAPKAPAKKKAAAKKPAAKKPAAKKPAPKKKAAPAKKAAAAS